MGTYEQGILGAFSGLVGPVVGANFRGKNVMRGRPKKTKKMPTENQLAQRAKFAAVTAFLTPANSILSAYFANPTGVKSRYNLAMSYHLTEAVEWDGVEATILFDKALFSKGSLLAPQNLAATAVAGSQLQLDWVNNSYGNALPTDKLLAVVYEPIGGFYEFFFDLAKREDLTSTITLPDYLTGATVQVWGFMVSANGKLKSTSQYLGAITMV